MPERWSEIPNVTLAYVSNEGALHWTGVFVDVDSKTIEAYDPYIVPHMENCVMAAAHLDLASRHARQRPMDFREWRIIPQSSAGRAKQTNSHDCGIFTLAWLALRSNGVVPEDMRHTQADMAAMRARMAAHIYRRCT